MLLGWECVACQVAFKIPPNMLGRKIEAPEKCSECGGTLFLRVEGIPGINAHPVYPDSPVADPAPKHEDAAEAPEEPDDWRMFDRGAEEVDELPIRQITPIVPGTWLIYASVTTNLADNEWYAPGYKIIAMAYDHRTVIREFEGCVWHETPAMFEAGFKHGWRTSELMVDMAGSGRAIIELKRDLPRGVKLTFHTKRVR